jgi:hypothetical protein
MTDKKKTVRPTRPFEDAVRAVLKSPQTPEQLAKKAARKAKERKKQKQEDDQEPGER